MADAPKKSEEKKPEDKKAKDVSGMVGEALTAVMTVLAGAAVAGVSVLKTGGMASLEAALLNASDDISFGERHSGVVRARNILWFWMACIAIVAVVLIVTAFTTGLLLATGWSAALFLIFAAGAVGLQVYAWPVHDVGLFAHRRAREPVDRARKRVRELEALRDANDAAFKQDDLADAASALTTAQNAYNLWVTNQGANTRSSTRILGWGLLCSIMMGLALVYGIVGRHDGGPYTYEQVLPYVVLVCILTIPTFLIPLLLLGWTLPPALRQIGKGEDVLTHLRRLIKAGLIVGKNYADVSLEEDLARQANGDDVNRNSSQIFLQRVTGSVGVLGLKVICACVLVIQHALFFPSTMAFVLSLLIVFTTAFLQMAIEKHNRFVEAHPLLLRVFGLVGGFSIYVHFFLAGGAPYGFRGLNWWWSDYGPFADIVGPSSVAENVDSVSRTGRAVADGVVRPVSDATSGFGTSLWHMTPMRIFVWFLMMGFLAYVAFRISRHLSEEAKKTDNKYVKWFQFAVGAPIGVLAVVMITIVAFRAPGRFDTPPSPEQRDIVQQLDRYGRATDRSTALTVRDGANRLEADNARRVSSPGLERICALNDLGYTRCTGECFAYHHWLLPPGQTIADMQSQGRCYTQ